MVAINPTTVSQRIIMPHVVQTSDGKRSKKGLILTLIATSIFFSMISVNMEPDPDDLDYCENYVEGYPGVSYEETEECMEIRDQEASSGFVGAISGLFCCGAIIVGIVAMSAGSTSTRAVVVNQNYVPQATVAQPTQQVIQTGSKVRGGNFGQMPLNVNRQKSTAQETQPTFTDSVDSKTAPSMDEIDKLAQEAKNLELARDFPRAAEMYQKAGLFAEAGRIRQTYLEKDQPMVQIGQIGDSVVKDSVIMGDKQSNMCPSCGSATQPEWKFCPSCNSPL